MGDSRDGAGTPHFVLVHGLGHGAWCWYKVIALLEAAGYRVTALDLTSSGNNQAVADEVTDIAQYVQPLIDFLGNYEGKVILVGHSLGGSAISYAMEAHPGKVEKAAFLAAIVPLAGQFFVPFGTLLGRLSLFWNKIFMLKFGNGIFLPSSVSINLEKAEANFYNRSPPEDVELAYSHLKAAPFRPFLKVVNLTESRHGSIPRFYIKTVYDNVITPNLQESYVKAYPPQNVFTVPESDHSAFFSQPEALANILISIANS